VRDFGSHQRGSPEYPCRRKSGKSDSLDWRLGNLRRGQNRKLKLSRYGEWRLRRWRFHCLCWSLAGRSIRSERAGLAQQHSLRNFSCPLFARMQWHSHCCLRYSYSAFISFMACWSLLQLAQVHSHGAGSQ
jgi:hypothetical protein